MNIIIHFLPFPLGLAAAFGLAAPFLAPFLGVASLGVAGVAVAGAATAGAAAGAALSAFAAFLMTFFASNRCVNMI